MYQKTLIDTHPSLLKYLASKNPFFVILNLIPILAFFLIQMSFQKETYFFYFLGGLLYWSFLEYGIHRWLYHIKVKSEMVRWVMETFHVYHHKNIHDKKVLNAGWLIQYPLIYILLLPFYYALDKHMIKISWIGLGLTIGYIFYEFVHFGIHYKQFNSGYMNFIQKYHMYHHEKKWHNNYGNTSALWDFVFNTYDPSYKLYSLTEEQKKSLISNQ